MEGVKIKAKKGIKVSDIAKYIVTRQPLFNDMKNSRQALHNNISFVNDFKLPNVLNLLLSNEKSKLNIYSIGM